MLKKIGQKTILTAAILTAIIALTGQKAVAEPLLLELFTSTLCPACYSADKNAKKINAGKDIFVLSYHVNYWDTKSQKDPYSAANNMLRHDQYRRLFKERRIYTPYAILSGVEEVSSGDLWKMGLKSNTGGQDPYKPYMQVRKAETAGQYVISMYPPENEKVPESQILLVVYDPSFNKYEGITATNIVSNIQPLLDWKGESRAYTVALKKDKEAEKFLIILQEKDSGKVLSIKFL